MRSETLTLTDFTDWFILSSCRWVRCKVLSSAFGVASFVLYDDLQVRRGRVRKGMYGNWLVESETRP